jgi:hypothetical protein
LSRPTLRLSSLFAALSLVVPLLPKPPLLVLYVVIMALMHL